MSDIEILFWMIYGAGWPIVMVLMRKEGLVYAFFAGASWPGLVILIIPFWLFKASKRLREAL